MKYAPAWRVVWRETWSWCEDGYQLSRHQTRAYAIWVSDGACLHFCRWLLQIVKSCLQKCSRQQLRLRWPFWFILPAILCRLASLSILSLVACQAAAVFSGDQLPALFWHKFLFEHLPTPESSPARARTCTDPAGGALMAFAFIQSLVFSKQRQHVPLRPWQKAGMRAGGRADGRLHPTRFGDCENAF